MQQIAIQNQARQTSEALEAMWMLLTVILAVEDEDEIARLMATGIPALLRCSVSGMAFRQEAGAR